jgi:hypothetical protein
MRVVVADDIMLMRQGIVRLLRDAGIGVVAKVENAEDLLLRRFGWVAGRVEQARLGWPGAAAGWRGFA